MPLFDYTSISSAGKRVHGSVDALNPGAAAMRLQSNGLIPINIVERINKDISLKKLLREAGFGRPTTTDLVLFTRQMYTIAKAGLPWLRGLRGLASSMHNQVLKETLEQAIVSLEAGRDLSQALTDNGAVFPDLYISMVRVGEQTGTLETVFVRLSEYLQNQQDMRERVTGAMRYPVIVIAAIFVAVGVLTILRPEFNVTSPPAAVEMPPRF